MFLAKLLPEKRVKWQKRVSVNTEILYIDKVLQAFYKNLTENNANRTIIIQEFCLQIIHNFFCFFFVFVATDYG